MATVEDQQSKSISNGELHKACVSPSPSYGIMALLLDALEKVVVWMFYTSRKRPPLHFLSGNFAPVPHETYPQPNLPVHGTIPSCMNGEFFRVGPNPKHPPVAGYHWFDGDGMIHGLRIKDGKATYVSRYVKTSRLQQEDYFGAAKFLKLGDLKGFFGLFMAQIMSLRVRFGVVDTSQGFGTGNTALAYHDGRLLALNEGDKPYALRILEDGDLQTIGLLDYEKRLNHPFTAHPKLDPKTGELFTFGYQFQPPYCTYRVISKDGIMQDPVTITVSGPVMMHDFAITENYAIFMDLPLYFLPGEMAKGGYILKFDASKKARFGILPRYAKNESLIKWFELPSCYIFHNANAWEEGDEVVLFSCRVPDVDLEAVSGLVKEKIKTFQNELYELRFNLVTGSSSQKRISASAVDFPRINENYIGSNQQFAYCTVLEHGVKVKGLAKFDLLAEPNLEGKKEIEVGGNVRGVILFGPGRYGSEAIFVPRTSELYVNEDDGYLICFSHDENSSKSEVLIFDAKTMSSEPVATISLPSRVPYGFHAFFINEEGLLSQKEGFAG